MGFWDKIGKPLAIGAGAAMLGSYLFPQTTSMLTGGLLGDNGTGFSGIGPLASGRDYSHLLAGGSAASLPSGIDYGALAGAVTGGKESSIWSNPTVLSSGILAGTSLLGGLFGSSSEEDQLALQQAQLEETKRQFDAKMGLEQQQLAQALELARIQSGGASRAAGISAAAQRAIAEANAIGNAATMKSQALQIPLAARENQVQAAQNTGAQSGNFFASIIPSMQRPALRG